MNTMKKDVGKNTVVYGLSTEGYQIASSLALRGFKVSLVDEAARMAITLKPEIARSYPNVSSLLKTHHICSLHLRSGKLAKRLRLIQLSS